MPVLEVIERTIERETIVPLVISTPADAFLIDDTCPHNAGAPHQFTFACGELVCVNCARLAWA